MTGRDLLLGVDFGTGGCKVSLVDTAGNIVAARAGEYRTSHPRPGWAEQDPADWYALMCRLLRELHPAHKGNLLALAMDSFTHGAVLLDGKMRPVRPTIIWTDQRSAGECARLRADHFDLVFGTAGQAPAPTWTLPQLAWLRDNEPENFVRIRHISFVKDYVRYLLTGESACDYIEAQGTMLWDLRRGAWSEALCALAGIAPGILPRVGRPTDPAGRVTAGAAADTGLPEGLQVIMGASDSAVEGYAAGAIRPGQCVLKLATAGNVNVMTDAAHPHPETLTYAHVVPGMWYTVTATNAAAACQRWFRDLFRDARPPGGCPGEADYERLNELAAAAPPGANGVFFHPYLMGERSPYWDPDLRGSFTGLSMGAGAGDLSRALLEGVAFSLRDCYRTIERLGLEVHEFILIGGGARSEIWRRIVCDVFNAPLTCPAVTDASFGSALLAGVGAGVFADEIDAVRRCAGMARTLSPTPETADFYARRFKDYRRLHDALAGVYGARGEKKKRAGARPPAPGRR